jgi:hypothetical protein
MKRLSWSLLLVAALLMVGCGKSEETTPETLSPVPREPPVRLQSIQAPPLPAPPR